MLLINRRNWLQSLAVGSLSACYSNAQVAVKDPILFGFSLYGMKSLQLKNAITTCAEIGYQAIELALMPGWPAEPKLLTADDRKTLRKILTDHKLILASLMENLNEPAESKLHNANLDRLKAAAELGHAISPSQPPVIETILGGKPNMWDKSKQQIVDRLGSWADIGRTAKVVITVKPHVSNALHRPADARWLHDQIRSDWLKLAFDYSHFILRGFKLNEALQAMIPHTRFVHIKDAKGTAEKFEFLLPGEGTIDYSEYFHSLRASSYRGSVIVEVSGMISNQAGYDPIAVAKKCFANMKPHLHLLK